MRRIVQHYAERRPKLVTLVRKGDPYSSLVLVVTQLETVEESTLLAALLSARLVDVPGLEVLPRLGGVTIFAPIEAAAAVLPTARRLDNALRTPVSLDEVARSDVQNQLQRLRHSTQFRTSTAERSLCLHEAPAATSSSPNAERSRQRAFSEEHARWGVVGTAEVVAAVDVAVRTLEAWPRLTATYPERTGPDQTSLVVTNGQLPHLDIAWWTPSVERALNVKHELQSSAGAMKEVLAALPTPMVLDSVRASPLMRGTCVALSISQDAQAVPASLEEFAVTGRVAREVLHRLAGQPSTEEAVTLAILEQTDPGLAAELAALVALSADVAAQPERMRIEINVNSTNSVMSSVAERTTAAMLAPVPSPETLPLVRRAEQGQGNLYALIGSPCATFGETSQTVGATGLLLRLLATRYHEFDNVTIDPWITANGVGLIGHTPRLSIHETSEQQAIRLGETLGRVVSTLPIGASDLWEGRSELLANLGPGTRPALWRALIALSPQQPGLVLPDGQFSSIEAVPMALLRERRAELLRLPLRLAVIENENPRQAVELREAVMRWVSLFRLDARSCPELVSEESLKPSESVIQSKYPDPNDAANTIAMPLPARDQLDEAHSDLLQRLLGGPSGWLAQRIRTERVVASVDARVVGGLRRRGLVVAIGSPIATVDAATANVRGLLRDLGNGVIPDSTSIATALSWRQETERLRQRSPLMRVEDLWLSRSPDQKISESTFRDFLKRAFVNPPLFEVRSVPRPTPQPGPGGRAKR